MNSETKLPVRCILTKVTFMFETNMLRHVLSHTFSPFTAIVTLFTIHTWLVTDQEGHSRRLICFVLAFEMLIKQIFPKFLTHVLPLCVYQVHLPHKLQNHI